MDTTPTATGSGFKTRAKDWAKRHPKATGLGALALIAFAIYANASSPSDTSSAATSPAAAKAHAPTPTAQSSAPEATPAPKATPGPKATPAPSHVQVPASAIIEVMKAKGEFGKLCSMQAEATTSALQQIEFAAFARGYGWQHSPSNDGTPTPRALWDALTQACAR